MPRFVIERHIPGAGNFTEAQLKEISLLSMGVLQEMGPAIQWIHSFVTDDVIYCIYVASDEGLIREHAKRGGFPATRVSRVANVIDPTTAE